MQKIHLRNDCDERLWDEFIEKHPNASVFQSRAYYESCKYDQNSDALAMFAFDENDVLVALVVGVVLQTRFGYLSSRCVIQSGPLFLPNYEETLSSLLSAFNREIKGKVILTQIRNSSDNKSVKDIFEKNGYQYKDHLNIHIQFSGGEEIVFSKIHKHRRRNIKLAQKELSVARITSKNEFQKTYHILEENYRRYKLPLISYDVMLSLFEKLSDDNRMLVWGVYYQTKLIGTLYAFAEKDCLYCWYACSLKEYYKYYPNDLIHWEAFRWGIQNNLSYFDFGGAGQPNKSYGVRDFKLQFGGEIINFGRYEYIHRPFLYTFAKIGFYILRTLKIKF